jgi:outer membrane immunogenic protein
MRTRTLAIVTGLGLLAPLSAHADAPGGDIVDQILQTLPPAPGHPAPNPAPVGSPPPSPVAMTASPPNPAPASPAPVSSEPLSPPPGSAAPPGSAPASLTPSTPSPPVTAAAAPSKGDILDQAVQTPPPAVDPLATDSSAQWTGFYLGANLGFGTTHGGTGETCVNSLTNSSLGCDIINSPALSATGIIGGGQIGYMMPFSALNLNLGSSTPPVMIGVEADMQGTGISATQNVPGPFNFVGFPPALGTCSPCSFSASQKIDWFSTVRGRVGVPVDNFLIYGTGGMIFGSVSATQNLNFTGSTQGFVSTTGKVKTGPVAGGGVEILLGGPFSAKLEGLYYDLGSLKTSAPAVNGAPGNFTDFKSFGFHGVLVRLGINVRLGGLGGS